MIMALSRMVAVAGCLLLAGMPVRAVEPAAGEIPVWPPAPAEPRIEFVASFSRAEDLGIAKGLLARLKDWVFGAAETRLVRPMAVFAAGGVIHVADPGAGGVHRFDRAGGSHVLIVGAGGTALPSPVGLAGDAKGDIYVTDSKLGQLLVIRRGAREATPLKLEQPLRQPTGIAFDEASGRLYVVDTANHCIVILGRGGERLGQIGHRGSGNGEFNFPTYVAVSPQGRLYVTDSLNFRVQAFDQRGVFVGAFGRQGDGFGDAGRQKGVATDRHGHIYVVDALLHAFQIFDDAGRLLLPVGGRGHERGEFWLPTGIFIERSGSDRPGDDLIYVADSYNRRVQVLRHRGRPG